MDVYNLVSFAGIFVLMAVAWVLSANHRKVNYRVIAIGVGLQLALAAMVFRAPGSTKAFEWADKGVNAVLSAARAGQVFVFGYLGRDLKAEPGKYPFEVRDADEGFILAFQALPIAVFFAALMGLLYYWRIMPLIIRGFSWVFTRLMRVSGAESLCAASNIFVGVESATAVRPYLTKMTRSELTTILTAGMATVASTTLGLYVLWLKDSFPTIAGHLLSASVLSAPAAIVMSKLLVPEDGRPVTLGRDVKFEHERESGAFEAIITGAMAGVKLVVGIVALLIAFIGLVALVDMILGGVAGLFGLKLALAQVLGYVMWPFAVVMGVPVEDAAKVGEMLGMRMIVTEIPAYLKLKATVAIPLGQAGGFVHPRSAVIAAYALCGFAHVGSLAIFVGGISALVPERRKDLAAVGPRALMAATLACLMTGAVAGVFYHTQLTAPLASAILPAP